MPFPHSMSKLASRDWPDMGNGKLKLQIVIAVHTTDRPIGRAVDSVLSTPQSGVIVVAHGLKTSDLRLPANNRLAVIECPGGQGFPGVPFNQGIANCHAPLIGIMGSDDWFESGALSRMVQRLETDKADAVIAPLQHGRTNPLTLRHKNLQASRDRLFYRTAPLGLFRKSILQNSRYSLSEDVHTGEDFTTSVRLWTDGHRVSYYAEDPAYVVGDDAKSRVTTSPRSLQDSLLALNQLVDRDWVRRLRPADQNSLAVKLLRVHILGSLQSMSVFSRSIAEWEYLTQTTRKIVALGSDPLGPFSVCDRKPLEAILAADIPAASSAWHDRQSASMRQRLFPTKLADVINPESNVRHVLTSKALETRARFRARN